VAITTAFPNSFKKELFEAKHNFLLSGGNTFKLALALDTATLSASTTNYSALSGHEVSNSGTNYTTGGNTLTRIDPALDSSTAIVDFADLVFSTVTLTARGCIIYNTTTSNAAVYVGDFGANKSASSGDFTVAFPAAAAATAILRIA
jgi:hypothetical protein